MLLRLSKMAAALAEGAAVSALPGIAPDPQKTESPVQNGLQGRLSSGAAVGSKLKQTQGPRAYAPRLGKP